MYRAIPVSRFSSHRQRALVIESPQVVEELEGPHERLRGGRVHEIEVDQVLHAKLEQRQHLGAPRRRKQGHTHAGAYKTQKQVTCCEK